jgi:hypothetical protein
LQPLGGIALAFNCRDELRAMLQDSLPVDSEAIGIFMDSTGRVLASTHAGFSVGDTPDMLSSLQAGGRETGHNSVRQWQGRSYLIGQAQSQGYREFKTSDGYREDVQSVLLTAVDSANRDTASLDLPQAQPSMGTAQFGVVQCGRMLFALASIHVIEAVSAATLAAPAIGTDSAGLLKVSLNGEWTVLPAYDGRKLTGQEPMSKPASAVAIVVHGADGALVLLVDRLVDVIVCDRLTPPPGGLDQDMPWISGYLHDGQAQTQAVFVLDPGSLRLHPVEAEQ